MVKDYFEGKTQASIKKLIGKKVKLGSIDMYGMLGRDNHPKKTDSGKIVKIIGFMGIGRKDGSWIETLRPANKVYYSDEDYAVLIAKTSDGRTIEVISYEIAGLSR